MGTWRTRALPTSAHLPGQDFCWFVTVMTPLPHPRYLWGMFAIWASCPGSTCGKCLETTGLRPQPLASGLWGTQSSCYLPPTPSLGPQAFLGLFGELCGNNLAAQFCSGGRQLELMQKGEEKPRFISGNLLLQTDQGFRKTLEPARGVRPVQEDTEQRRGLWSQGQFPPVGSMEPTKCGALLLPFQRS